MKAGVAVLVGVLLACRPAIADERSLSLQEAIDMALRQNADVVASTEDVAASRAARAGAAGAFGPRLRAEGNVTRWDGALEKSLGPGAPPLVVREEVTNALTVTVSQPITPLWTIYQGWRFRDLDLESANGRGTATRRDVTYQVIEAWYRLLQAEKLVEVARQSIEQLEAQVKRAKAFEAQGQVGRNDVLRAELGLAAARQRRIQSEGAVTLAQGRLALLVGLSVDQAVRPDGNVPALPGAAAPVGELETQALSGRVELAEIENRIAQARIGAGAGWARMVPQVSAVGSYQRQEGSLFGQPEAYFVGLFAQWDVWDWGTNYQSTREGRARVRQAIALQGKATDGIRLEVRAAYVGRYTAQQALAVAEASATQAEENFRIETKRYEANSNTTFDVLDAETLLTQSRAQLETARYDYFIADAALRRAVGETQR